MDLGTFSVSLSVKDIQASRAFYEKLDFEVTHDGGEWMILSNGQALIGLFQGMFEGNILTFNPPDVRAIQRTLAERGIETPLLGDMQGQQDPSRAAESSAESGPAHITLTDPDGNSILIDQF